MVIKRKYETYGMLLSDETTKTVIYSAMRQSSANLTEEQIDATLAHVYWVRFELTEIGSGIPGDALENMKDAFEKLDKTHPFDNKLTYRDVTKTISFPSRKGNAIMQYLIRGKNSDLGDEIVQIAAYEKDGDYIKVIEPWELNFDLYF